MTDPSKADTVEVLRMTPCDNYDPNGKTDACVCGHSMYSHDLSKSTYCAKLRIAEHARRLEQSRQDLIAEAKASGDDAARRAYMLQGAALVSATQASMAAAAVFRAAMEREAPAQRRPPQSWLRRLWGRWWLWWLVGFVTGASLILAVIPGRLL